MKILYYLCKLYCDYYQAETKGKDSITLIVREESEFKKAIHADCNFQFIHPMKELPRTILN